MSDLINRSALYDELLRLEELARNRVLDTPTNSPCYSRYLAQLNERTALKHMIADAPTAYDLDKVVERLEERKDGYVEQYGKTLDPCSKASYEAYDEAIDIVKTGGSE